MSFPDYRVAVEVIIKKGDEVLLVKRAGNKAVTPGVWWLPTGKVELTEIPVDAVIREIKEETALDIKILRELSCRPVVLHKNTGKAYRLVYIYLVELKDETQEIFLNYEHSEYRWVSKEEILAKQYPSLLPEHIEGIFNSF